MKSSSEPLTWLETHFGELEDPRLDRHKAHHLLDIIGLTIVAVISGADNFVSIEQFGNAKLEMLRKFLPLANGIPSHDTLGRCFSLLDAQQVEASFISWVGAISELTQGQVIAIDGKAVRGSRDSAQNKHAIHLVSAWAAQNGICLGQVMVGDKSNEITAIPKLLEVLDIDGCIVTIDAIGTQKDIAAHIIDAGADYVLALKDNHPELYGEVVKTFDHLAGSEAYPFTQQWDKGHGRIESRRCCVLDVTAQNFDWILKDDLAPWPALSTIIMVEARRWGKHSSSLERRYYLSSLKASHKSPEQFNQVVRAHWAVENNLHWCLDVTLKEDACRVRAGHADHNLAIMRRLVLNLLKLETSVKIGLQNKRLKAAWDDKYLFKLLRAGNV